MNNHRDPFNFFPNPNFEKEPNYRVEYVYNGNVQESKPAIFKTDEEAISTAEREASKDSEIKLVAVCKYTGRRENGLLNLETIYKREIIK